MKFTKTTCNQILTKQMSMVKSNKVLKLALHRSTKFLDQILTQSVSYFMTKKFSVNTRNTIRCKTSTS